MYFVTGQNIIGRHEKADVYIPLKVSTKQISKVYYYWMLLDEQEMYWINKKNFSS